MKTYEMVALADKNGKTYQTGDMLYNFSKGFHDDDGEEWGANAFLHRGLQYFIHMDEWKEVNIKEMTLLELETKLGYRVKIVG